MKCPHCGDANLIHDTRDLPYPYKGESAMLPHVTGAFCPACRGAAEARVWMNQLVSKLVGGRYTTARKNSRCINLRFEGLWDTVSLQHFDQKRSPEKRSG